MLLPWDLRLNLEAHPMLMNDSVLKVKDFWYRYPGSEDWVLRGVNFEGKGGEVLLIAGSSGSGKSTLMKSIVGLIPHIYGGEYKGSVYIGNRTVAEMPMDEIIKSVSYVSQNPDNQIVSTLVREDVAFSLENFGFGREEIVRRVKWALSTLKISDLEWKSTLELSDGQKQRVALAGAIVLRPKILIVDEPTGFLDPWAARKILKVIRELSIQYGILSIIVEHRVELLQGIADEALILDGGKVVYHGNVNEVIKYFHTFQERQNQTDCLISKSESEPAIKLEQNTNRTGNNLCGSSSEHAIIFEHVGYRLPNGNYVFKDVSFKVMPGELVFLVGPNGSGKSTLLRLLNGVYKPSDGRVLVCGIDTRKASTRELSKRVGLVLQNPDHQLFAESVIDEIEMGAKNFGVENSRLKAIAVARDLNIYHLLNRSPFTLSWGEKKRVCIASVLVWDPPILALDEPTVGLDPANKLVIARMLSSLINSGKTIIVATHDIEFIKQFTHSRIILVAKGRAEERSLEDIDWANMEPMGGDDP
jgi:energy-coupling factor transport system ATP-binding protein